MDRGVDRCPGKSQGHVCVHSMPREASLQVTHALRRSVVLIIRGWEFQGWAAGTAMFAVTTHPDHHVQKAEEGHRLGMLSGSWLTGCLKQLYRVTARLDLGRHVTTSRLHWKCKTRILRLENTRGPPKRQLRAIP